MNEDGPALSSNNSDLMNKTVFFLNIYMALHKSFSSDNHYATVKLNL